jgi:hypothetical protein
MNANVFMPRMSGRLLLRRRYPRYVVFQHRGIGKHTAVLAILLPTAS